MKFPKSKQNLGWVTDVFLPRNAGQQGVFVRTLNDEIQVKSMHDNARRISYFFICGVLVLAGWMHLATPLLAALFAYFALSKLWFFQQRGGKLVAVLLFVILLCGASWGVGHFIKRTVKAAPEIARKAIPSVLDFAKQRDIELPFSDYDSLKELGIETAKSQTQHLAGYARFARGASTQAVFLLIGMVVAMGLFINPRFDLARPPQPAPSQLVFALLRTNRRQIPHLLFKLCQSHGRANSDLRH